MKTVLLLVGSCIFFNCIAQKQITPVIKSFKPEAPSQCISPEQEKIMKERVRKNKQKLMDEGILHIPTYSEKSAPFKLGWPLKPSTNFTDSNYYGIASFVDLDPSANLLDWNCGNRTYDGHNGTDIALWPFPWYMMDNKMVKVIAADDGVIVDKHDGEFDRECYAPNVPANYVILQHSNGYQTIYYHLKTGTVTKKSIGATVNKGEIIGYVGSSGTSTGPHLHFTVLDESGNVLDPYKGSCNNISKSLWKKQDPYWGKKIHKIMVTTVPSVYPYCPNTEQINEFNTIPLGWSGHFMAFLSEVQAGDTLFLKIQRPNNSVWQDFYYVMPADYILSYFFWYFTFDLNEPKGTWKWKVTLNKKTYTYDFTVSKVQNFAPENTGDNDEENIKVAQTLKNENPDNISVFPNPSKENIQVQLNSRPGNYTLEILNAAGIVVKKEEIILTPDKSPFNFNLSNLISGVYKIHIYNDQTNLDKTLIVE